MRPATFELCNLLTLLQNTTGVKGFANITTLLIAAGPIVMVAEIMGDLIIIYRCWVLWSKNYWVTVVPTLSAIGTLSKS